MMSDIRSVLPFGLCDLVRCGAVAELIQRIIGMQLKDSIQRRIEGGAGSAGCTRRHLPGRQTEKNGKKYTCKFRLSQFLLAYKEQ